LRDPQGQKQPRVTAYLGYDPFVDPPAWQAQRQREIPTPRLPVIDQREARVIEEGKVSAEFFE